MPRWSRSAAELFADPAIEAVILALPTFVRAALALEAFRHGKHVLIEKPTSMNAAEINRLIAARGNSTAACCASRYRSFASAMVARDFIRSGPRDRCGRFPAAPSRLPGRRPRILRQRGVCVGI